MGKMGKWLELFAVVCVSLLVIKVVQPLKNFLLG